MLAAYLQPGDCVPLLGDMGSGKTCFVQGIASGLGVPAETIVNSPSFTLINQYAGRIPLYHVDLFRLETGRELEDLEIADLIHGDGVTVIEWPQLLLPRIPEIVLWIQFVWEMVEETSRSITFTSLNERFLPFFGAIHG